MLSTYAVFFAFFITGVAVGLLIAYLFRKLTR